MQSAFSLDGQDELRTDCMLAEAMGDCGLAETATGASVRRAPAPLCSSDDDDSPASCSPPRARTARPRCTSRSDSSRGAVAEIVDRIFANVYSKIEASEVLAGLGELRVVQEAPRQGRLASQSAVRKERRVAAGKQVVRTAGKVKQETRSTSPRAVRALQPTPSGSLPYVS